MLNPKQRRHKFSGDISARSSSFRSFICSKKNAIRGENRESAGSIS